MFSSVFKNQQNIPGKVRSHLVELLLLLLQVGDDLPLVIQVYSYIIQLLLQTGLCLLHLFKADGLLFQTLAGQLQVLLKLLLHLFQAIYYSTVILQLLLAL